MDASKNGRYVVVLVPNAVGKTNETAKDIRRTPVHAHTSMEENGEGFSIGSASINSVFTAFLTPIAVKPVTQTVASHPPTAQVQQVSTLIMKF